MIKLVSMGSMKYIKKYSTLMEAEKDLKLKNDRELISTITKDTRFRSLMLKGEDYHILVKSENVSQVVDLFKEYGYYVNF